MSGIRISCQRRLRCRFNSGSRQSISYYMTPGGSQGREHGDGFPNVGLVMSIIKSRTGGNRSRETYKTKSTDFHHPDPDSGYRRKGTGETASAESGVPGSTGRQAGRRRQAWRGSSKICSTTSGQLMADSCRSRALFRWARWDTGGRQPSAGRGSTQIGRAHV